MTGPSSQFTVIDGELVPLGEQPSLSIYDIIKRSKESKPQGLSLHHKNMMGMREALMKKIFANKRAKKRATKRPPVAQFGHAWWKAPRLEQPRPDNRRIKQKVKASDIRQEAA